MPNYKAAWTKSFKVQILHITFAKLTVWPRYIKWTDFLMEFRLAFFMYERELRCQ